MHGADRTGPISLVDLRPDDGPTHPGDDPAPLPPPPVFIPPEEGRGAVSTPPAAREAQVTVQVVTTARGTPAALAGDPLSPTPPDRHDEVTSASDSAGLLEETIVAGRYRIEEPIGEGGMGRVFRVRHRRLDKSFALKLMRTAFSGDTRARALFYREARLASSLSHPNIVSIVDFGEDARLGAFMVMELLDGEPLSVRLRREGKFPVKFACDVIQQIAEALHYIHQKQIVHCDIKPDNILLCPVPGTERRKYQVKLLDFGLARLGVAAGKMSMMIDGTPEYMAPERIRGQSPVQSMDIYGLGVLCYEMLTGRLPFKGSVAQVMDAHVRQPPPAFADALKEPIDERAEALVLKALAKDPAARQKDMAAFLYELRTLMDMLGVGRRRGGPTAQMRAAGAPKKEGGRDAGAAAGFDLSPLPMAGLDADGTIVVANRAFAQFLTGDPDAVVEGQAVTATRLVEIHPDFSADLRATHAQGVGVQRHLRLRAQDGKPVNLMLWMVPGMPNAGEVHMTVHSLDVPK